MVKNKQTQNNKHNQKPATVGTSYHPKAWKDKGKEWCYQSQWDLANCQEPWSGRVTAPAKEHGSEKGKSGDCNFSFSLLSPHLLLAPPIDKTQLKSHWQGKLSDLRAQPCKTQAKQRRVKIDLGWGIPAQWSIVYALYLARSQLEGNKEEPKLSK